MNFCQNKMFKAKLFDTCNRCIQFARSFHSAGTPLNIFASPVLNAEPLKKKKRIDPAVLRERAERKVRRLGRDIRRLEKVAKKLKPIAEVEVPRKIFQDNARFRHVVPLEEDQIYESVLLEREWANYKRLQHTEEIYAIKRVMLTQEKAMDALQEISSELYEHALQVDENIIPFKMTGPVFTPPIKQYDHPDGNFIDVSKKYLPIAPVEVKTKVRKKKKA